MDPSSTNQLLNQPGSSPGGLTAVYTEAFSAETTRYSVSQITDALCVADMVKQMQAFQQGGPWVQARNFAVLTGVGAGLTVALKRIRGKEDVYSTCVLYHTLQ